MNHFDFMGLALKEALKARDMDEVPVGAVLVDGDGKILAMEYNRTISSSDPTAHAEILALRSAAKKMANYRLPGTVLYSTIEPCPMCMGAIIHARVALVVFGALDSKWGAAGSLYDFCADTRLNHQTARLAGVRAEECRTLLQDFFRMKRKSVASSGGMT